MRARRGRRDASRRTARGIACTVSGALGRRVNGSRARGSRTFGVPGGNVASRMRRHCRGRPCGSWARGTSSGRARSHVARYVSGQRGRSGAHRQASRVATNAVRKGRNSPHRSGCSYKIDGVSESVVPKATRRHSPRPRTRAARTKFSMHFIVVMLKISQEEREELLKYVCTRKVEVGGTGET